MAFCSNCGTELTNGAKFCPNCGSSTGNNQVVNDASENSQNYSIELSSVGENKLLLVKAMTDVMGLGIKEASDLANLAPCILKEGLSLSKAIELASAIQKSGATIAIKENGVKIQWKEPSSSNSTTHTDSTIEDIEQEKSSGSKLKKYGLYALGLWVLLSIIIGLGGKGCSSSDSKESQQTDQKQEASAEQTQTKEESNPYAKFVGKYVLYDDEGHTSFFHFKVNEKGHFLQSLGITSEYNKFGTIEPVSESAFVLSLYGNDKIYLDQGDEDKNWVWADGVRYEHLGPNKVIRFDIKECRMYPDNEQYENREYKKPDVYKFRFTRQ